MSQFRETVVEFPSNLTGGLIRLIGVRPPEDLNIPVIDRNEAKIQAKREHEAEQLGIRPGAERPGVIDTGAHPVDNEELSLFGLIDRLRDLRFRISDVHVENVPDKKRPGKTRPVTVIGLDQAPGDERPASLVTPRIVEWAIREVYRTFKFTHVWVNPKPGNTSNFTINVAEGKQIFPEDSTLVVRMASDTRGGNRNPAQSAVVE